MSRNISLFSRLLVAGLVILSNSRLAEAQTSNMRRFRYDSSGWSINANVTLFDGGLSEELVDAMRIGGFNDISSSGGYFSSWFSNRPTPHPYTRRKLTGSIAISYQFATRFAIRLHTGSAGFGDIYGYSKDINKHVQLREHQVTTALILSLITEDVMRLGIGPARHKLQVLRGTEPSSSSFQKTRFGYVLEAGLTLPEHSGLFIDITLQHWRAGSAEVGPFIEISGVGGSATIPSARISFNKTVLTIGIGIRQ